MSYIAFGYSLLKNCRKNQGNLYCQGITQRFTSFKSNALNDTADTVEVYTNKNYIVVTWPIYDFDKDEEGYVDITSDYSKISKEKFWNYIVSLSDQEQ